MNQKFVEENAMKSSKGKKVDSIKLSADAKYAYVAYSSSTMLYPDSEYRTSVPVKLSPQNIIRFFGDCEVKNEPTTLHIDLKKSRLFEKCEFNFGENEMKDLLATVSFVTTKHRLEKDEDVNRVTIIPGGDRGNYYILSVPIAKTADVINEGIFHQFVDITEWGVEEFVNDIRPGEVPVYVPKMPSTYSSKNADEPVYQTTQPPSHKITKANVPSASSTRKMKIVHSIDAPTNYAVFVSSTRDEYPGQYVKSLSAGKVISLLKDRMNIHSIREVTFIAGASEISKVICANLKDVPQWKSEYNRVSSPLMSGRGYLLFLKTPFIGWNDVINGYTNQLVPDDSKIHVIPVESTLSNFQKKDDALTNDAYSFMCLQYMIDDVSEPSANLSVSAEQAVPVATAVVPSVAKVDVQPDGKKTLKIFRTNSDVKIPVYATPGSSGFDLAAYLPGGEFRLLHTNEITIISTGLKMSIPVGFEIQIRSRSGLSTKGIVVANSPGTIDSDYRNELKVILVNIGKETYKISHGDRIAQAVLCPVVQATFSEVTDEKELGDTERGQGGLGSTGK